MQYCMNDMNDRQAVIDHINNYIQLGFLLPYKFWKVAAVAVLCYERQNAKLPTPKRTLSPFQEEQLYNYIERYHQYHRNQQVQTELSWINGHFPKESRYVAKDKLVDITER